MVSRLTTRCRKILGQDLESCSLEELQELESKLEQSLSRIRKSKASRFIILYNYFFIMFSFDKQNDTSWFIYSLSNWNISFYSLKKRYRAYIQFFKIIVVVFYEIISNNNMVDMLTKSGATFSWREQITAREGNIYWFRLLTLASAIKFLKLFFIIWLIWCRWCLKCKLQTEPRTTDVLYGIPAHDTEVETELCIGCPGRGRSSPRFQGWCPKLGSLQDVQGVAYMFVAAE